MINILSFGGGVDSSTLIAIDLNRDGAASLLGITRNQLDKAFPSIDRVVFSDTGAESDATYDNIIKTRKILALSGKTLTVVKREGENITEWCLRLGIIPVMPGGSHVCSMKFKGEVMKKWAASENIESPTWIIGIEADEKRRARFTKPKGDTHNYVYPLVELGITREKCLELLIALGWHTVTKSSCVFCPFKTENEILDMYLNDPTAWKLCEEIEEAFRLASIEKNQRWIDNGKPLNKGGRAPRGMWRKNSFEEGARLFCRTKLTMQELKIKFEKELSGITYLNIRN